MKIPNINQKGIGGAEQISLGAISSAANAKFQTSAALTKVVDDYQTKVTKAETAEEYSRLANGFSRDTGEAWDNIKNGARTDENGAPTHNQMLDLYNVEHKKIAKRYSDQVTFDPNRGAFSQYADSTLTSNTNAVRGEVGRRQVAHLTGAYEQSKINLMAEPNGLSEFAKLQQGALEVGLIDASKMATDYDAFQHEFETNRILSEFNTERDMGRGQAYIDRITGVTPTAEGEEPLEFPQTFDDGERLRLFDKMTADLKGDAADEVRAENKLKQEQATLERKNWDAAQRGQRMLNSGRTITKELLAEIQATTDNLTDEDHKKSMQLSFDVYNNVQMVMSMTQKERLEALNETYDPIEDFEAYTINQATQEAYRVIEKTVAADPHQAWVMYGGGEPMEKITEENLVESLAMLQDREASVSAWLGEDTVPMSLAQLAQIKKIGVSGLDEILTAYDEVEAGKILTLLYEEDAGEMAVVGSIALQKGGEEAYSHYMKGAKVLRENPDYKVGNEVGVNNDSARSLYHNATQGLFQFNSKAQNTKSSKSMQLVTNSIYISLAEEAGIQAGTLDSELYEQAITMAVGNIVDHNGNGNILLPRGMTENKFDSVIGDLTPAQIENMGGFELENQILTDRAGKKYEVAVTPLEVLSEIKSGNATLRQGSNIGQYQLWIGGRRVNNSAGKPFILDINEI